MKQIIIKSDSSYSVSVVLGSTLGGTLAFGGVWHSSPISTSYQEPCLRLRKPPSKCKLRHYWLWRANMFNQLIQSPRLPSNWPGKYTQWEAHTRTHAHAQALTVSHALAALIRLCVYYQSDSWNEHELRPLQAQWDTCLLIESLLGQFSTSSAYLPVASHLFLSVHHVFAPCLFILSRTRIQIESSSVHIFFSFWDQHSSLSLSVSFPLLHYCNFNTCVWWH